MSKDNFNTPVLFLIFNRPHFTKKVFEAIREAQPTQLFIAADGPRQNRDEEKALCDKTREIASSIDWNCEVKTLFRDQNLGCGIAVSTAISWFFSHVEQGIILEDDCLPSASFFPFCEEILSLYKNDSRITSVCGANLLGKWQRGSDSYFFSREAGIWGWATWKRAWDQYDYFVTRWKPEIMDIFKMQFDNPVHRDMYVRVLDKIVATKQAPTWDYQWIFSVIINSCFGIIPNVNLISNIGFGEHSTHTSKDDSNLGNLPVYNIHFPMSHPLLIMVDREFDIKLNNTFYKTVKKNNILKKILNKITS